MTDKLHNITADAPEALREEMRRLRSRLDTQTIITDKLLRTAVKDSTRFSRSVFRRQKFLSMPFGILCMFFLSWKFGYPIWFGILTAVMLVAFTISDYYVQRISDVDYTRTPLLEIQERLIRQKRLRARRMLIGMFTIVVWFGLFVWTALHAEPSHDVLSGNVEDFREGSAVGGAVGGVIGGTIGYLIYRRMQRDNTRAINSLRDFTDLTDE